MERRLRYKDLEQLGICANRVSLMNWIRHAGFPVGRLLGPNSRSWSEAEVAAWIASRPTGLKATPSTPGPGRRGRPRKAAAATEAITE